MNFPAADFDERYRAIAARDTRFDGQFVTAVRSTGIYCRPSCPARTPKPENVTFYPTSAAAHEAGFRACKRCVPEAAPGSPAWDVRSDTAARAMRLIASGLVEREGVQGLAERLGYSSRHRIGPWTADYVRMRVLGDPDVLLPGDAALRAGAVAAGLPSDPKSLSAWALSVSPWRSYLSAHLWRSASIRPARFPQSNALKELA